jgi:iron complex transport system substrate-binding protein
MRSHSHPLRCDKKPWVLSLLGLLLILLSWREMASSSSIFMDEVGRKVTFSGPPKRIVSLAPNITEILFALGMDEAIVGVTLNCNYPEKAKEKVPVGSYIRVDFERILSLNPDLVIATGAGNTRDMVNRLERLGILTYVIFPKKFDEVLQSIHHLGQLLHREEKASSIIQEMKERKQKVIEKTKSLPRPRVFLQIGESPMVTVGKGSFADDLIRLAGGENIAGGERQMYPHFGREEVLRRSPEVIIISTMNPKGDYDRMISEWNRWKTIPAVKQGRIHLIHSDLIDRPSPRMIEGLEEMARLIHRGPLLRPPEKESK